MGSNWNVKRHTPSITELTELLADATTEANEALRVGGEYSHEYRMATETRLHLERKLAATKHREAEKERLSNLPAKDIVDRVMGER
jgi:hypothetical protein